jgi:hypothetical protein
MMTQALNPKLAGLDCPASFLSTSNLAPLRSSTMREVRVGVTVLDSLRIGLTALMAIFVFLAGCSTTKTLVETPPIAPATPGELSKENASNLPPPELKSVQEAVKRVFKDAALMDTSHQPVFVAGDFNGDLSQDIAVVVKPVPEKLSDMNEEFPAWILRDPFGSGESRGPRLRIAADDILLAVIHGYGANGWRDPQATQTFLLKNAVGSDMETRPLKQFAAANQDQKLPLLRGDLVGEMIQGKSGYLYYAGATYSWYDPKTFTGDPEPRRGHGDQRMKK